MFWEGQTDVGPSWGSSYTVLASYFNLSKTQFPNLYNGRIIVTVTDHM